ncbi:hypothetical protein EWM64_g9959 [Hericium alpestre]|uniref:Uncharacterized protein n=1 Tax=Hericium alpestre TaxID=135208 RepID=A0A4Y9ZJJ1_9AGAM|nr:hypothetical protein EWM64_g9959 [Hericium alpestre]
MPKIPTLPHQPKPAPYRYPPVSKLDTANAQLLLHPNDFAISPRGRTALVMHPVGNASKASKEGTGECKCTGSETVVYCFECHEYIPKASEIMHTCYYLKRQNTFHEMWCCKDFNRNQDFGVHSHPIQAARHLEYLKWAYFGGPMPPWVQARLRNRTKAAPAATPIPVRLTANAQTPHTSPQQTPTARPTPAFARGLSPFGWNPSPSPAPVAGPSNAAHVQAPRVATPAAPVPQHQLNEAQQDEIEQMMFAAMDEYATKAAQQQQEQQAAWRTFGQQDNFAQPRPASSMQPSNTLQASGGICPSAFVGPGAEREFACYMDGADPDAHGIFEHSSATESSRAAATAIRGHISSLRRCFSIRSAHRISASAGPDARRESADHMGSADPDSRGSVKHPSSAE